MKIAKKVMFSIGMSGLAFLLFSCSGLGNLISIPQEIPSGTESNTELPEELSQQERIYQLAKASGYLGTYEEWLESIRGDQIELTVRNNAIQWRYASSNQWITLISLDDLKGEDGKDGQDGQDGKDGQDGLTPHIGANGNWWIGETDTGISASGNSTGGDHSSNHNHTVTYHYENGSTFEVEVECGHTIDEISAPIITGKSFVGWNYEYTGEYWNFMFYPVTKDMNLYAEYQANNYSVVLNPNGGIITDPYWSFDWTYIDVSYGQYLTLPMAEKTGYDFLGWYDDYGNYVDYSYYHNYEYSKYLTALWDNKEYTINFDLNGGKLEQDYLVVEYDTYYTLPTPSKANATFAGWYLDNQQFDNNGYYNYAEDITLKARWRTIDPTIIGYYEQFVKVNEDCGGDALSVITEGKLHVDGSWANTTYGGNANWRFIAVVDGDGKIAYAVVNPANGYGGPCGSAYYAHPDYADDYTTNPALNILEGYGPWTPEDSKASTKFEVIVPEGGFIVLGHGMGTKELLGFIKSFTLSSYDDGQVNTRTSINSDVRLQFDSENNILSAVLKEDIEADYLAVYNEYNDVLPTVYDCNSNNVALSDFTVAFDENGKIRYISKTAPGYGGPADGFYHDGSYAVKPGEQCAIFLLEEQFAGWPNKVEIDGVEFNAWTLYTVVVPEGWTVVTGNEDQMKPLLTAIDKDFVTGGNYFEVVSDGMFNGNTILTTIKGKKNVGINLEKHYEAGVKWSGSTNGCFEWDESEECFYAEINLSTWNRVIFTYTDENNNETILTYTTTQLLGLFTSAETIGADWTTNLYHEVAEGVDSASLGVFYTCTGGTYYAYYYPNSNSLMVTDVKDVLQTETLNLVMYSGVQTLHSWDGQVELSDVTIVIDEKGLITYAFCSAYGYGGPMDGGYHDGTYQCVTGQQCGIFNVYSDFAMWPNKTENGENAWDRYHYEVPEGYVALTGSVEDMNNITSQIFGKTFKSTSECYTYFAANILVGTYNHLKVVLP